MSSRALALLALAAFLGAPGGTSNQQWVSFSDRGGCGRVSGSLPRRRRGRQRWARRPPAPPQAQQQQRLRSSAVAATVMAATDTEPPKRAGWVSHAGGVRAPATPMRRFANQADGAVWARRAPLAPAPQGAQTDPLAPPRPRPPPQYGCSTTEAKAPSAHGLLMFAGGVMECEVRARAGRARALRPHLRPPGAAAGARHLEGTRPPRRSAAPAPAPTPCRARSPPPAPAPSSPSPC
jgi:hypothetical protein